MKNKNSIWPQYEPDEIEAVIRVLNSGEVNYWTGHEGRKFEQEFAEHHNVKYGVAVANGTLALQLSMLGLGIGPGDEVVVTPRTFIASVSSIVLCGARPVFADVDRNSGNIAPDRVQKVLTSRTKAIMAVHLAGWPCDMDGLLDLANSHNLFIIEDCAQAHGARYKGRMVGGIGNMGAFSFCQDKIMTTGGEGGMVITNDHDLWQRMWSYKDHGKRLEALSKSEHLPGFKWTHDSFGTNWRLTEMQSAIGRVQLGKLTEWNRRRRENAFVLIQSLSGLPGLRVPVPEEHIEHAWYKFYAYIEQKHIKKNWSRDRVIREIQEQGVPCMQGICPEVYLEKAFEVRHQRSEVRGQNATQWLRSEKRLPVARELGETGLMFLVDPTFDNDKMQYTADSVIRVMQKAVQ